MHRKELTQDEVEAEVEERIDDDEANKDEIKAKRRAYYRANKKVILTQQKVYREAHQEELSAKQKVNRAAKKEEIKTRNKDYYEGNKEEIKAKHKDYYGDNKEVILATQKAKYRAAKKKENNSEKRRRVDNAKKQDLPNCDVGTQIKINQPTPPPTLNPGFDPNPTPHFSRLNPSQGPSNVYSNPIFSGHMLFGNKPLQVLSCTQQELSIAIAPHEEQKKEGFRVEDPFYDSLREFERGKLYTLEDSLNLNLK